MKRKFIALIVSICIVVCGVSIANAQEKGISNATIMEVNVEEANVKFEKGEADVIETEYYGSASDTSYNLETTVDGNTYRINLNYIGNGMAPTIKEGGVIVRVPDDIFSLMCINGKKGSGIVLDYINVDTDLTTEGCAVVINNEIGSNKINVDSNNDSYEISSVSMLEDFNIKSVGSVVKFAFTEQPLNLKFHLTDKGGYVELPTNWSEDFSIGLGRPQMTVEVVNGIFQLSIGK